MVSDPKECAVADPDIVTFEESCLIVEGLIAWLKRGPEVPLIYIAGGKKIVAIKDAARAGRVLECLMHTSGLA